MLTKNLNLVNNFKIIKHFCSSFKSNDLTIVKCKNPSPKPTDLDKTIFGTVFTDHMLQIDWSEESGWKKPEITPVHNFSLHPGCLVFHYAPEIFEGLKAFYGVDDRIRIFRPEKNIERMNRSATRAMLPCFDKIEFLECMKRLISLEKDWVPKKRGHSLYIRPTMIGVDPKLGVTMSKKAILYILLCPVGSYYSTGFKPVSLMADAKYCRAWPGGPGDAKMGSNYAPTIFVQNEALKRGCQQVLWLFGDDHLISEVGTMNIFIYWINKSGRREVVTPPLNGTILPGITRMSLLELLKAEKDLEVSEREIPFKEILEAIKDKRLLEIFGSGTACVISPVERINYNNKNIIIPTMDKGAPLTMKMLQTLTDIQYGVTHKAGWTVDIS